MGFLGFGGNNNQTPNPNAPTTSQRLIGAGLTAANPILGMGYRLVTGYRNRNSVDGTYYGPMNRSGYDSTERAAIRAAAPDQRQALMDLYRGDNAAAMPAGPATNGALSAAMQQYQQQGGQSTTDLPVMDMIGGAGSALQGATNQAQSGGYGAPGGGQAGALHRQGVSTQQQISQLPAAMQTYIRNNGLPQSANDIRMATNAMYMDGAVSQANSNYGQDIGFVAPQARAPREK